VFKRVLQSGEGSFRKSIKRTQIVSQESEREAGVLKELCFQLITTVLQSGKRDMARADILHSCKASIAIHLKNLVA
jgi:hypothetical protein